MKIERQQVGTVDVFMPVGPLVDNDGEKFCKTLVGRLKAANPRVVVAMHEVPYVDSVSLDEPSAGERDAGVPGDSGVDGAFGTVPVLRDGAGRGAEFPLARGVARPPSVRRLQASGDARWLDWRLTTRFGWGISSFARG
jgi:hypothetical protein